MINTNRKIRALFYGDSPYKSTGFAQVMKNITKELYKTNRYEIKIFGITHPQFIDEFGREPNIDNWRIEDSKIPIECPKDYPRDIEVICANYYTYLDQQKGFENNIHGTDKFVEYVKKNDVDIIFILNDPYVVWKVAIQLNELRLQGRKFVTMFYFPVDSEHVLPEWYQIAQQFDIPVTYTQFGLDKANEIYPNIVNKLTNIYHGVDTKSFYPMIPEIRRHERRRLFRTENEQDLFVILDLNRNQPRKDPMMALFTFSKFLENMPEVDREKCKLVMYMEDQDVGCCISGGCRFFKNLILGKNVFLGGKYYGGAVNTVEDINLAYNIADVGFTPTLGEGWGLMLTEALATKLPFFAPNNTVHPELLKNGEYGTLIKCDETPVFLYGATYKDPPRYRLDVEDSIAKLKDCYYNRQAYKDKAEQGYKWVQTLIWGNIVKYQWAMKFREAEEKLKVISK